MGVEEIGDYWILGVLLSGNIQYSILNIQFSRKHPALKGRNILAMAVRPSFHFIVSGYHFCPSF